MLMHGPIIEILIKLLEGHVTVTTVLMTCHLMGVDQARFYRSIDESEQDVTLSEKQTYDRSEYDQLINIGRLIGGHECQKLAHRLLALKYTAHLLLNRK